MRPGTLMNALTALTLTATPAMAQETAVEAILQADRDFAAMAAETGPGPAFEAYMDDVDGRLIRGTADALVGSAEIRGSFDAWPEGILLHWEPLEGFASEGGGGAPTHFLVVVAEQTHDGCAFNRGALLNAGFLEAQKAIKTGRFASVILHDVDLLPSPGLQLALLMTLL